MWWHLSHETCTPVLCTEIPNDKALSFSCPPHHHKHPHAIPAGDTEARPISCVQAYSPENIKTGGQPRRAGECELCTNSAHAEGHFGPLGSSRSTKAISTPMRLRPNTHAGCPSDLFAHNTDGGIVPYSCVEKCPAGTHATPPGDFPYQGAKACVK
jgi:hypothetical protein